MPKRSERMPLAERLRRIPGVRVTNDHAENVWWVQRGRTRARIVGDVCDANSVLATTFARPELAPLLFARAGLPYVRPQTLTPGTTRAAGPGCILLRFREHIELRPTTRAQRIPRTVKHATFFPTSLDALVRVTVAGRIVRGGNRAQQQLAQRACHVLGLRIATALITPGARMRIALVMPTLAASALEDAQVRAAYLDALFAPRIPRIPRLPAGRTPLPVSNRTERAIVDAARAEGWQVDIIDAARRILQFRTGSTVIRFRNRRSDINTRAATQLARNKWYTKQLLLHARVTTPQSIACTTLAEARAALRKLGAPVVVKPCSMSLGNGVSIGVRMRTLAAAVREAQRHERTFLVEEQVHGNDFRVLVLDGRILGMIARRPPELVADGVRTLAAQMDAFDAARVRALGGWGRERLLRRDAHLLSTLREQGWTLQSIPRRGTRVALRRNANVMSGGTAHVIPHLHPRLARTVLRAVEALGLRYAGVDLFAPDPLRPLGWIIEVNAAPTLALHLAPDEGAPQDVLRPLLRALARSA